MKKHFYYLSIVCFLHFSIYAQVLWQNTFKIQNRQSIIDAVKTADCGIIFVGWWHYINDSDFDRNLLIYKIKESGELEWSKIYTIGTNLNSGRFTEFKIFPLDHESEFIILGVSNSVLGRDTDDDIYWLKINNKGDKIALGSFQEDYQDFIIDRIVGAVQDPSENIYWVQQRMSTDKKMSKTYLRKMNSKGELMLSVLLDDIVEMIYKSILISKDQSLFVFGSSRQDLDNGATPWRLQVIKTSLDGSPIWKKYFGSSDQYNMAFDIEEKQDGALYLISSTASIIANQFANRSINLITIDLNGNEKTTCAFPHWLGGVYHPTNGELDAIMFNDTLILGTETNDNSTSAVEDFAIYKIANTCHLVSIDSFIHPGIDFLHAIKKLDASRFLLLGESFKDYSYEVPCYAYAIFLGDSIRTCLTPVINELNFKFEVFTNLAQDELCFTSNNLSFLNTTLAIYTLTGKLVTNWKFEPNFSIQKFKLNELTNGMYFGTVYQNGIGLKTFKFLITKN